LTSASLKETIPAQVIRLEYVLDLTREPPSPLDDLSMTRAYASVAGQS
jgi:hypothetical protein